VIIHFRESATKYPTGRPRGDPYSAKKRLPYKAIWASCGSFFR
jgi:hypothetical protein